MGREPGTIVRDFPGDVAPSNALLALAVKFALTDRDAASANAARDALADQGVGFVAFRGAATVPLVRRLDATAGMTRLSAREGLVLWRVLPRHDAVSSSRVRLEDSKGLPLRSIAVTGEHGQTEVAVGAAAAGARTPERRLVVAEPAGWADHARVTFAGRELVVVDGGGQPAYVVPASAGQLTITLAPTQQWWRWWQLGLLLVVLFLAAPFGSARSRRRS